MDRSESQDNNKRAELPIHDEEGIKQVLLLLLIRKGTDFLYYKRPTIRRRIHRRMAIRHIESLTAYYELLKTDEQEQEELYLNLLIPVTSFFRDKTVFENLCGSIFPHIAIAKEKDEPIRFWIAACSTGQEAYSIAICIKEFVADREMRVQIFATDISAPAIKKARSGIYTKKELEGVSTTQLKTFFKEENGKFRIDKAIREMCVFAEHNFLKDPPFSKMDFISCRNVLIYLEPYLQKKALTNFHYALNEKGVLLLGKSETATLVPDLFAVAGKSDKLFARKDATGRYIHVASDETIHNLKNLTGNSTIVTMQTDYQKKADEIMLTQFMPAGVVINETMDIVQFRGDCSQYLLQISGTPTHNLLKLAKSGLSFELRTLVQKCRHDKRTIVKDGIPVEVGDGLYTVSIRAIPLQELVEPHYLILFSKTPIDAPQTLGNNPDDAKESRIYQLEQELSQTRVDMRNISDEQEAANEELQSANEELLSSGEEMQSLNEELETSKEELQSINEELTMTNLELNALNDQLVTAKKYSESIVATIHQPLLVLDKDLIIKTANNAFYKTFELTRKTVESRLIFDLDDGRWNMPELHKLLEETKVEFSDVEIILNLKKFNERVLLMSGAHIAREFTDERMTLLVIEDITEQRRQQKIELELLDKFQNLVFQAPVAMCILRGRDYVVEIANKSYLDLVGKGPDFVSQPLFFSMPELVPQGLKFLLDNVMDTGMSYYGHEHELFLQRNNSRVRCFFNFVYQPMIGSAGEIIGIIVVVTDVTEQVVGRKKLENQVSMVQELLMTAPGWICTLTGPKHVFNIINDKYQQVFGKRALRGLPIMAALPELKGQGIEEMLDEVYNSGKSFVAYELPINICRDEGALAEVGYFNFSYQAIYDDDKKIEGVLAFGYEVTEQVVAKNQVLHIQREHSKELEARVKQRTIELISANDLLNAKNKALQKMNVELESFAYVSSHDLQEPLRKIQTFSAMILNDKDSTLSEKSNDFFQRMQVASGRMQTLIRDLLAYSHANVSDQNFEHVSLNILIDEVANDFAEAIEATGAKLQVATLCDVNIIPLQFRQIVYNLLSNSLKFAKKEIPLVINVGSRIEPGLVLQNDDVALSPGQLLPKDEYCHIVFKDNGVGFHQEYGQKIFEIFQRLHGKEEYVGTGIGLAIVKKIVEHHNGIITATGIVGEGATFNIYLPHKSRL